MLDRLAFIYTPTKTTDGAGGFTYTYGTARRIFINLMFHKNQPEASVIYQASTVNIEDILNIEGEYYRIESKTKDGFSNRYKLALSKVAKPIGL